VKLPRAFRGLDELLLELGAVTVMAIIGLLLVSHAVHTGTAARLESAPLVGPVVTGFQTAIDMIVTPPQG
jgi:hypothetical protein